MYVYYRYNFRILEIDYLVKEIRCKYKDKDCYC